MCVQECSWSSSKVIWEMLWYQKYRLFKMYQSITICLQECIGSSRKVPLEFSGSSSVGPKKSSESYNMVFLPIQWNQYHGSLRMKQKKQYGSIGMKWKQLYRYLLIQWEYHYGSLGMSGSSTGNLFWNLLDAVVQVPRSIVRVVAQFLRNLVGTVVQVLKNVLGAVV